LKEKYKYISYNYKKRRYQ